MKITTDFTAIPESWIKRADIRPSFKLIMGRLFTLSNIDNADPEVSASGLAEQTGLSWDSADRAIKKLERAGVLNFKERRRFAGEYPFKVYSINRPKLMEFMKSSSSAGCGRSSASGGCYHPLPADKSSARSGLKEEEKEYTRKNTRKNGHPETSKPLFKTSGNDWQQSAPDEPSNNAKLPLSPVDKFDKFILPEKIPTVSGTSPEPLEKTTVSISGQSARTTPATDTERRQTDSMPTNGQNIPSASLTVPDELAKRIRIADACRQIDKWKGRKPELVAKYFDVIFAS
jgi:DNA-binding transcriptional ArsR family regulator